MATRTIRKFISFENSFTLGGFDEILPAGTYEVETDEELLEGLSFRAYRRFRTIIHLPGPAGNPKETRALTTDPAVLEAAMLRDRDAVTSKVSGGPSTGGTRTHGTNQSPADRAAISAAENEGMICHVRPPGWSA